MRLVFMGSPRFSVPSLERLIESSHEVAAVVTQPDKPKGRGQSLAATPIKELALHHGIPALQPRKLRKEKFHETLAEYEPQILVVVAYGRILPKAVLDVAPLGAINVHASLLPKYRGAGPVNWALINGERETGVTIMQLDEGMDTGAMISKEKVDILDDDDALSMTNMLSVVGADLLVRTLDRIEREGKVEGEPQDDTQATYAPLLSKEDAHLDFTQPVESIICRQRGTTPWPGAFAMIGDKPMRIHNTESLGDRTYPPPDIEDPRPGDIVGVIKGHGVVVRAGDGDVILTQVQPPGKRSMGAFDACNGGFLKIGQRLA